MLKYFGNTVYLIDKLKQTKLKLSKDPFLEICGVFENTKEESLKEK